MRREGLGDQNNSWCGPGTTKFLVLVLVLVLLVRSWSCWCGPGPAGAVLVLLVRFWYYQVPRRPACFYFYFYFPIRAVGLQNQRKGFISRNNMRWQVRAIEDAWEKEQKERREARKETKDKNTEAVSRMNDAKIESLYKVLSSGDLEICFPSVDGVDVPPQRMHGAYLRMASPDVLEPLLNANSGLTTLTVGIGSHVQRTI
eukprot:gene23889-9456_t